MFSQHRSRRAFTLMELLVSMAVLILLILTVVGLINAVTGTTTSSRRHLDDDNEARRVLDRIGTDFARMFKRADADSLFAAVGNPTTGANDKFFFYSEAPAYFDASSGANASNDPRGTASLIGYRVNNVPGSSSRWQLERLAKGLTWDGAAGAAGSPPPGGVVFLTYPPGSPTPSPTPAPTPTPAPYPNPTPYPPSTLAGIGSLPGNWGGATGSTIGTYPNYDDGVDADYQVISSSVFRLEYCFVSKTLGTATSATGNLVCSRTHDQTRGFKDVSAIVVAIAILNPQARAFLPVTTAGEPPDLSKLVAALPDPTLPTASANTPVVLMAETWNGLIRSGALSTSSSPYYANIPASVASQVRVYQRYFYLNTSN